MGLSPRFNLESRHRRAPAEGVTALRLAMGRRTLCRRGSSDQRSQNPYPPLTTALRFHQYPSPTPLPPPRLHRQGGTARMALEEPSAVYASHRADRGSPRGLRSDTPGCPRNSRSERGGGGEKPEFHPRVADSAPWGTASPPSRSPPPLPDVQAGRGAVHGGCDAWNRMGPYRRRLCHEGASGTSRPVAFAPPTPARARTAPDAMGSVVRGAAAAHDDSPRNRRAGPVRGQRRPSPRDGTARWKKEKKAVTKWKEAR